MVSYYVRVVDESTTSLDKAIEEELFDEKTEMYVDGVSFSVMGVEHIPRKGETFVHEELSESPGEYPRYEVLDVVNGRTPGGVPYVFVTLPKESRIYFYHGEIKGLD